MIESPTPAGFAEPVLVRTEPSWRKAPRFDRRTGTSGPAFLFFLLLASFIPSLLIDFNANPSLWILLRVGRSADTERTLIGVPTHHVGLSEEAICPFPAVADSAASSYEGKAGPSAPVFAQARAVEFDSFQFLPGARTPRAPPT